MEPEIIQELFDYSDWAVDLIWPYINQLDDEQFTRNLGYSFGSIRNQIIHLISSHRRWLYRLQGRVVPQHFRFTDFPTKSSSKDEWDMAKVELIDYVMSLDQAALNDAIPYKIPSRSIDASHPRWQILMHLINHSTDHRSQLLAMLNTHFGIETPEQDFIIYLWQKGKNV
jgi:uncharacterized damage-inducible protein DinB